MTEFARLALAGLLALAAGGDRAGRRALKAKIGVLRLSSSAPVFIAQDKGYFKEAGLDIELKFFDAAQPIAVATDLGRCRFRHHRLHRRALQSRRQGHAEGDRRHEPRKGRLSPDRLFRQQQRLCRRAEDAEGSRGQAHRGDAGRLQLPLFARPARRQIRLQARRRKGAAAAVAVECRRRAEGRNRRCRVAAGLDRAQADGRSAAPNCWAGSATRRRGSSGPCSPRRRR